MVESLQTITHSRPDIAADAGDEPGGVDVVFVHAVGGERRQFEKRRARIDQRHHAFARQQFATCQVPFAGALWATLGSLGAPGLQVRDERKHRRLIRAKLGEAGSMLDLIAATFPPASQSSADRPGDV